MVYLILIYLVNCLIWAVLSAIINPQAFLPYATASFTLITFTTTKYKYIQQLAVDSFNIAWKYIQDVAQIDVHTYLIKMEFQQKINDILSGDKILKLAVEAVDSKTYKNKKKILNFYLFLMVLPYFS